MWGPAPHFYNCIHCPIILLNILMREFTQKNQMQVWISSFIDFILSHINYLFHTQQVSPGVEQSEVKFREEILERELQFCFRAIEKVKENESSWNYLNG